MLIKDHIGDWAICVAQWVGMEKGISNGRHSKPGNPGYFSVIVRFLRDPTITPLQSMTLMNDKTSILESRNLSCNMSKGTISIRCPSSEPLELATPLHRVALAFTLSTLYLLVQPRPEVMETRPPLNGSRSVRNINVTINSYFLMFFNIFR